METKSLVGVAIGLGIPIEDAIRIHKDYLMVKKTPKIVPILKKHLNSIPAAFMPWFEHIDKNDVKSTEIANAIDCIKMCNRCGNKKMTLKMK